MSDSWKSNVLAGTGMSEQDLAAAKESRNTHVRDGGVCVCGHPAKAHTEKNPPGTSAIHDTIRANGIAVNGIPGSECHPSKAGCGCTKYDQVLTAEDLRKFRHSTKGPAFQHALSMGIFASMQADKEVVWLPGVCCRVCGKLRTEEGAVIVPIAYEGREESYVSTATNIMICDGCRENVRNGVV